MCFSRKQVANLPSAATPSAAAQPGQITTKRLGDAAESLALTHLVKAGLRRVEANYRTPGRGGGEVDLIMCDKEGTLVFVEVRHRKSSQHGGAGASIGTVKQRRLVFAARHYLMRYASPPPCRFDVVLVQGGLRSTDVPTIEWLRGAFEAD
ncbi:MAG TPA: YraN family protein [Polaromonas sp.]|uniref:YraN family protein n=1 Tax=Polaromonas sp. TaxID=1869339 RepID=UPI002D2B6824|nr:YraN family protein [Polaromonas sp.]HYW57135.1 YraN family protein [Polaromonas sp.]